jgi:hypothetical protein
MTFFIMHGEALVLLLDVLDDISRTEFHFLMKNLYLLSSVHYIAKVDCPVVDPATVGFGLCVED